MDLDSDPAEISMKSEEEMMRDKGMGGGQGSGGNHNHYPSKSKGSDQRRMVDITRDKPIKVAVRVVVPVRDHPKFNFVGKLLGPKGNSLKRLQEDTMCKMAVLGRGSMKDRHKEEELRASGDPKFQHLSEELHVEISAFATPAEAHARIAYALAEVRRFLVPDYNDDIRQEQMWEMQVLSSQRNNNNNNGKGGGGGGGGMDEGSGSSSSGAEFPMGSEDRLSGDTITAVDLDLDSPSGGGIGKDEHPALRGLQSGCGGEALLIGGGGNIGNNGTCSSNCGAVTLAAAAAAAAAAANSRCTGQMSPVNGSTATLGNGGIVVQVGSPSATVLSAAGGSSASTSSTAAGRKRPLLAGGPRTSMTPTKRTVMSLLARARAAQAKHLPATTYQRATPERAATLVPVLREDFIAGAVNLNLI